MRRDKIEIVRDLLQVCEEETAKTRILRFANIQYNSLPQFLEPLVREGYIEKIPAKTRDKRTFYNWRTTTRGKTLLREIEELLDRLGLRKKSHKYHHERILFENDYRVKVDRNNLDEEIILDGEEG